MKHMRNEAGLAMPLALMVMLVLSLLGTALWQYSMTDLQHVSIDERRTQAFYLARAGADATMNAWMEAPFGQKPRGSIHRVYLTTQGDFTLTPSSDVVGWFDAAVEEDADGLVNITVVATVDGTTQKVVVTSYPYAYGHNLDPPLYNLTNGLIPAGPNSISGSVRTFGTTNVTKPVGWHHPVEGAVRFWTSNPFFYINRNTYVGLTANGLLFESPVNLEYGSVNNDVTALFLSAEHVVFQQALTVERIDYTHLLLGRYRYYGTIVLTVPPALGIPGAEIGGQTGSVYGRVSFPSNARIFHTMNFFLVKQTQTLNMAGKSYYFRGRTDGIDIVRWHRGEYQAGVDFILIADGDSGGFPQGSGLFFWNP